jgi:exodeoxyribonuclease VII large subunit
MSEPESIKESLKTNIPEFSVSELAFSMKRTLEENYGRVRVRGELSRVSIAASGHMYSSLKDDGAVIDSVCWKGTMAKLGVKPEEGLEVICTGRISTYPQRSNYQLIIETMELAGEGALLKMLEERRKRLAAEGLFDEGRKRPLPFLPGVIGVVTSPTGAVIRDILHRLEDRFPRHVLVWPVLVQGERAAEQIAAAINGFQTIDTQGLPKPDLIIVARGGGSLEDLMPFNEEIVVRAAANSAIPIISAVGHETDTTLIDFAADRRAPTPTGAAEMAVPVRAQILAQVMDCESRMIQSGSRRLSELKTRLGLLARNLGDPARLLEIKSQAFDHLADKMRRVFGQHLQIKRQDLTEISAALRRPKDRLSHAQKSLERWSEQLTGAGSRMLREPESRLAQMAQLLQAYSFEHVLKRGFVVVRDTQGHVVSDPQTLYDGQKLDLQFKDQQRREVLVNAGKAQKPQQKSKPSDAKNPQQTLF